MQQIKIQNSGKSYTFLYYTSSLQPITTSKTTKYPKQVQFNRKTPTHFISIPLRGHVFKERVASIQNQFLQNEWVLHDSIVHVSRLHLTLFVLCLEDEDQLQMAMDVLKSLEKKIIDLINNQSILIQVQGMDVLKGTRDKAKVLYSQIHTQSDSRLDSVIRLLVNEFYTIGLLESKRDPLLHCTLVNYKYVNSIESTEELVFDARPILNAFSSYDFGFERLEGIELCKMGQHDENGYKCEFKLSLP